VFAQRLIKPFLLSLALLLTTQPLVAETMWVDDELIIQLRTGQGNQYRILRGLETGTPVEVLEVNEETGFSKVETRDGLQGWVTTHYLSPEPVAEQKLAELQKQWQSAQAELQKLRQELTTAREQKATLETRNAELQSRLATVTEELQQIKEVSSNALTLDKRNRELQKTIQELRNQVELLTAENDRLQDDRREQFLMLGAGLVLLGVLLAVIVPWLKPSRKHDTWA